MSWPWRRSFLHFAFHWQLCSCVTAAPRKVCASGCIASCAGSQVGGRVCEGEREIHDFRFFPKCLKVCAHCLRYKKPVMLLAARISLLCPAGAHSLFGSPRGEIRPVQTLIQKTRRLKKKLTAEWRQGATQTSSLFGRGLIGRWTFSSWCPSFFSSWRCRLSSRPSWSLSNGPSVSSCRAKTTPVHLLLR